MFCQGCGKETPENAAFCISCGAKLTDVQETRSTRLSTAAGIITIIDGSVKFVWVAFSIIGLVDMLANEQYLEDLPASLAGTIIATALALLAIIGGISAIQRRRWVLALAGAIAAILPLFPLGIASVILVALAKSKGEFEQPQASERRT